MNLLSTLDPTMQDICSKIRVKILEACADVSLTTILALSSTDKRFRSLYLAHETGLLRHFLRKKAGCFYTTALYLGTVREGFTGEDIQDLYALKDADKELDNLENLKRSIHEFRSVAWLSRLVQVYYRKLPQNKLEPMIKIARRNEKNPEDDSFDGDLSNDEMWMHAVFIFVLRMSLTERWVIQAIHSSGVNQRYSDKKSSQKMVICGSLVRSLIKEAVRAGIRRAEFIWEDIQYRFEDLDRFRRLLESLVNRIVRGYSFNYSGAFSKEPDAHFHNIIRFLKMKDPKEIENFLRRELKSRDFLTYYEELGEDMLDDIIVKKHFDWENSGSAI